MAARNETPRPNARRTRAALQVAGRSVADVAREAGISTRYMYDVIDGLRPPSARAAAALQGALGSDGWRYALGQTDTLPCPAPTAKRCATR